MNDFDTFRREAVAAVRVALQWFFLAVPMGLLCGFLGTLFHLAVEHATELRAAYTEGVKAVLAENPKTFDPKAYGKEARQRVKALVMERMLVCGCDGKA